MAVRGAPDLVIVGQVTVDDVVPAECGVWSRQLGGSVLYALAGARLWMDAQRIGIVARVGADFPFDVDGVTRTAGVVHAAFPRIDRPHLVEWLIYEPDGSRRSLPRNPELLGIAAEGLAATRSIERYRATLLAIAPDSSDLPSAWLPAAAVHLCPQVGSRHVDTLAALRRRARWISVDPSPHYSCGLDVVGLAARLHGSTAFLPSRQEVAHLLADQSAEEIVRALNRAGFAEVLLKRGEQPALLATADQVQAIPTLPVAVLDPTGAGDAFCGAFAACRLVGWSPTEAARRAVASAAAVAACRGIEAALELTTPVVP